MEASIMPDNLQYVSEVKLIKKCMACPNIYDPLSKITFYQFPNNYIRYRRWVYVCGRYDLLDVNKDYNNSKYHLCSAHFAPSQINSNGLDSDAIPSIFNLPVQTNLENELKTIVSSLSINTVKNVSELPRIVVEDNDEGNKAIVTSTSHSSFKSSFEDSTCFLNIESLKTYSTLKSSSKTDQESILLKCNPNKMLKTQNDKYHELCKDFHKLKFVYDTDKKKSLEHKHLNLICEKFLSNGFIYFMKFQNLLLSKMIAGGKYDYYKSKLFTLMIYFLGPMVYNFLKKYLYLPSPENLQSITKIWEINPAFNESLFEILSVKAKLLKPRSKECVLTVGKMSLKSFLFYNYKKDTIIGCEHVDMFNTNHLAKFVVVVMIHGLHDLWKQPVSYFFVETTCAQFNLQNIIYRSIQELRNISYDVKVMISDLDKMSDIFENQNSITPEKPYFKVGDKEIVYMYDSLNLIKETRNKFFRYCFKSGDRIANKIYLEMFYNKDEKHQLAPKLTCIHMNPNSFQKKKVKYAAELFSNTIAREMTILVHHNELSQDSFDTINFIESMNQLFDIFNSNIKHVNDSIKVKNYYGTSLKNNDYQKTFLIYMFDYFKYLELQKLETESNEWINISKQSYLKFVKSWLITISGLRRLYTNLSIEYGSETELSTNRLNRECLENFFEIIKIKNGHCNITCNQFKRTFKQIFCVDYFEHLKDIKHVNGLDDILNIVNNYHVDNLKLIFPQKNCSEINLFINNINDYKCINLPKENTLIYFCGYLIEHCLKIHQCEICLNFAQASTNLSNEHSYSNLKANEENPHILFGNSINPSSSFFQYIAELDEVFNKIFVSMIHLSNVGRSMRDHLLYSIVFHHPCIHFPKTFLVNLFIRLRIYIVLHRTNKEYQVSRINKTNKQITIIPNIHI